jgi:hypothetical protein
MIEPYQRVWIMRAAEDSRKVLVTVPRDVRAWLEVQTKYNGSTLSAEVVRSVRTRMEAAAKDRTAAAAAE